jgi:hypothetical protein
MLTLLNRCVWCKESLILDSDRQLEICPNCNPHVRDPRKIEWEAYMDLGMGIANTKSISHIGTKGITHDGYVNAATVGNFTYSSTDGITWTANNTVNNNVKFYINKG